MCRLLCAGLALLASACVFDTRGTQAPDRGSPETDQGQVLFPDGVLLNFPDAAPMQPQLDVGLQPRGPDQAALPPDSRPVLALDQPPTDLPPPACGPTCAGCCQGSTCQLGTEHLACGAAGSACVDCTSSGQQCVQMACVPISCSTNATCPSDKVCSKSKCVDPHGLNYRIWVIAAEITAKNPKTGGDWDTSSGPDPYVLIRIAGKTWYTNTRNDTLLPIWNQYVDHKLDASTALRFEVIDSDGASQTPIGVVELTPGVPATVLHTGSYTGADQGVKALKLELKVL